MHQFQTALRKSEAVCDSLFDDESELFLCVSLFANESLFSIRKHIRNLKELGLLPRSRRREVWRAENTDAELNEYVIAVKLPRDLLQVVLWCALASDLGVQPQIDGTFRIFDLDKKVLVFPYDDRGMDIVGNFSALKSTFHRFNSWLLEHDRAQAEKMFSHPSDGMTSNSL